jgi:hypothetical protein
MHASSTPTTRLLVIELNEFNPEFLAGTAERMNLVHWEALRRNVRPATNIGTSEKGRWI